MLCNSTMPTQTLFRTSSQGFQKTWTPRTNLILIFPLSKKHLKHLKFFSFNRMSLDIKSIQFFNWKRYLRWVKMLNLRWDTWLNRNIVRYERVEGRPNDGKGLCRVSGAECLRDYAFVFELQLATRIHGWWLLTARPSVFL